MPKVVEICVAETSQSPMENLYVAELIKGRGIVGDRYFSGRGTFSRKLAGLPDKEITLIESEQVDEFNRMLLCHWKYRDFRRNVVTRGVDLNALEGKEFYIGDVRLRGIRLCEPCTHLGNKLGEEVVRAMVHKTGLRAQILHNGVIQVGDHVCHHSEYRATLVID